MKFLSVLSAILSNKKDTLKNPKPYTVKSNYACEDSALEWQIKTYLSRERSAIDCLQGIIEHMAYRDCLHMEENKEIFGILEDFLESATWKTEWTMGCGDYNPNSPEPWLRCVYSIYDNILRDISIAETLLKDLKKEVTTEEVMNVIHNKSVTPEIYQNKATLEAKGKEIQSIICGGEFTPKEALLLIKESWELLYLYQSTYEAIEYCIAASENHTVHKYFDSAFRDFGYKMGVLYRKAKEK